MGGSRLWTESSNIHDMTKEFDMEKNLLTLDQIESQVALELPERETLALITLVIFDVASHNVITLTFNDINACIAAQVNAIAQGNTVLQSCQ